MHWYVDVLRKYAVFEGRSRRTEFWMFVLINAIIQAILNGVQRAADSWVLWLISGLYGLFVLIPGIAVTVRRLHDSNHRGWWWWLWIHSGDRLDLAARLAVPGQHAGAEPLRPEPEGRWRLWRRAGADVPAGLTARRPTTQIGAAAGRSRRSGVTARRPSGQVAANVHDQWKKCRVPVK